MEKSKSLDKTSSEFLFLEYQDLNHELGRLRDEGVSRLNFYLGITSSILAGLVLLSQIALSATVFQIIAICAAVFLLLLGWPIFGYTIIRDKFTDDTIRALSRIRHYFVTQNPSIGKYISRPVDDEPTRLVTHNASSIRKTIQLILGLLTGLIIGLVT